jgi:hypothetical protein
MCDKAVIDWALMINGNFITGFGTKFQALEYYRNNIVGTNPSSAMLWAKYYAQPGYQFEYTIV